MCSGGKSQRHDDEKKLTNEHKQQQHPFICFPCVMFFSFSFPILLLVPSFEGPSIDRAGPDRRDKK